MKELNIFIKNNLSRVYLVILLGFWLLVLVGCEKEPIVPFEPPQAISPDEIEGEWKVSKFYFLEEGYRLDLSAWVVYVDDSTFNIGTVTFNGTADFDLIYGTRAEGYPDTLRWGNNHNSLLQDSSVLGWNWRAQKPLCNITNYTYEYNPAQYFLGLNMEDWTTTYKTTTKWVIENTRYYDNQLELTGEHFQYRQLTLER